MEALMQNPALVLPDVTKGIQAVVKAVRNGSVPASTLELVHLRASQINGCTFCVDMGMRGAKKAGETDERLWSVAVWREATCFTEAERAALALTEAVTRLPDRGADAVSDELWAEVTKHFDEKAAATLIVWIATTNLFNRLNATVRQPPGSIQF
ncbi:MAG TPA: carboxymuconolactone decarboxylase family protein [Pseudonocardiaceae bacterium]|nr:carboxymuconolactone decarboxylase family protein [Pseudonocardiaceae bacterium]